MTGTTYATNKTVLLSCFRNEAPFVLEFVAHHKVLGFNQIVIASNDCTDGTVEILDALDAMGVIRHLPCVPSPNITPQHFAYTQARKIMDVDAADWLMILDADELLNVHVGDGLLADLIAAQDADTDLVLINWATFGAGGHERWANQPSSQRFVERARTFVGTAQVKSLIRHPKAWKQFSNHHPYGHTGGKPLHIAFAGGLWTENVAAESMAFGTHRNVKARVSTFSIAQINHYATRTVDSFALRRARGRGAGLLGKVNDRHTDDYFRRVSRGSFLDDTISRYAEAVAALMADYRKDQRLANALANGLDLYEAEISRYWQAHDAG